MAASDGCTLRLGFFIARCSTFFRREPRGVVVIILLL